MRCLKRLHLYIEKALSLLSSDRVKIYVLAFERVGYIGAGISYAHGGAHCEGDPDLFESAGDHAKPFGVVGVFVRDKDIADVGWIY